jgi:hypothetical protein
MEKRERKSILTRQGYHACSLAIYMSFVLEEDMKTKTVGSLGEGTVERWMG